MSREMALNILGLEEGFTEEELKNVYKKLVCDHHPDKFTNSPEHIKGEHREKLKDINLAFEYLKSFRVNSGSSFDLDSYRLKIINKMKSYYRDSYLAPKELVNKVKELVKEYANLTYFRSKKAGIDDIFDQFLKKLEEIYTTYEFAFYRVCYIDHTEVKEDIDYNVSVDDFCQELYKLENKYSKKVKFIKRIDNEIAKYKLYATCTAQLWNLIINVAVKNAVIRAKKSSFREIEVPIRIMHQEIESLFKLVDDINKKMVKVDNLIKNMNDEELHNEFQQIKKDYGNKSLIDISVALDKLLDKIEKIIKEQENERRLKEESSIVDKLYKRILNNYNRKLMKLNPVENQDEIKGINELFQSIMGLFSDYKKGFVTLKQLKLVSEISFKNWMIDNKVLSIINEVNNDDNNRLKIYLKRKEYCNNMEDQCFFTLREENGKYYMQKILLTCDEFEISEDELNNCYISLDELMKGAIYQGYIAYCLQQVKVLVLYEINVGNDYRYIITDGDDIYIVNSKQLSDPIRFEGYDANNKELLKDLIEKQLRGMLEHKSYGRI